MMSQVSTDKDNKTARINLKIHPKIRADFKIAARLRGSSISGLLHQFIVKAIREEREREPAAFGATGPIRPTPLVSLNKADVDETRKRKTS